MMISILSHIMEFRNGESGLHVHHINVLTSMLLERLVQKTGPLPLKLVRSADDHNGIRAARYRKDGH